jgi:hypothetical protein
MRRDSAREKRENRKLKLLLKRVRIRTKRKIAKKGEPIGYGYLRIMKSREKCHRELVARLGNGETYLFPDEANYYVVGYNREMGRKEYAISLSGWFNYHVERHNGAQKWTAEWEWLHQMLEDAAVTKILLWINYEYIGHDKGHCAPVVIEKHSGGGGTFQFFSQDKDGKKFWKYIRGTLRKRLPGFKSIHPCKFKGRFPMEHGCSLFVSYIMELMLADSLPTNREVNYPHIRVFQALINRVVKYQL